MCVYIRPRFSTTCRLLVCYRLRLVHSRRPLLLRALPSLSSSRTLLAPLTLPMLRPTVVTLSRLVAFVLSARSVLLRVDCGPLHLVYPIQTCPSRSTPARSSLLRWRHKIRLPTSRLPSFPLSPLTTPCFHIPFCRRFAPSARPVTRGLPYSFRFLCWCFYFWRQRTVVAEGQQWLLVVIVYVSSTVLVHVGLVVISDQSQ